MIHDSPNGQTHVLTGEIVSPISSCRMVQSVFLTRWLKKKIKPHKRGTCRPAAAGKNSPIIAKRTPLRQKQQQLREAII